MRSTDRPLRVTTSWAKLYEPTGCVVEAYFSFVGETFSIIFTEMYNFQKPTLHHHELYQFWIIIMARKIWNIDILDQEWAYTT